MKDKTYKTPNEIQKNNEDSTVQRLAEIINHSEKEVEEMIERGKTPWQIAKSFGKYSEYKESVMQTLLNNLDLLVLYGCLTREQADERIADFEKNSIVA